MMNSDRRDRSYIRFSFFPEPRVREIEIPGAPEFMRSVSALFISDVHLRGQVSDTKLNDLIQMIIDTRADILLLGGDYGEGEDQCVRFFDALASVNFPLGKFAVPGNNDNFDHFPDILRARGITMLKNRAVDIPIGDHILRVGGVDEAKYGQPNARGLFPDSNAYRVLLDHMPMDTDCDCDLQLSGHTHGGQWRIGNFTPYSLGFENHYGFRSIAGLNDLGDRLLFVSNGIGISKFPLRINVRPEICHIRFTI